jgi:site-specific DNA-methyltransferase (adenine-specific)
LIFRKPGSQSTESIPGRTEKMTFDQPAVHVDIANGVAYRARAARCDRSSCPFPEEIPDRLIRLYSYIDDVVLDPFAGSGQTLKVAKQLGRKYVGYETIEKYVQLARARVKGKSAIRPQQLIARFDKIGKDDPAGQSS